MRGLSAMPDDFSLKGAIDVIAALTILVATIHKLYTEYQKNAQRSKRKK